MNTTTITYLQNALNDKGHAAGPADGIAGPRTLAAIDRAGWVDIWAAYGFSNLGRVRDYDWMHHRFIGANSVDDGRQKGTTPR